MKSKKGIFAAILFGFLVLLCAAFAFDSYARANLSIGQVEGLYKELINLEEQAFADLESMGVMTDEINSMLIAYRHSSLAERRNKFENIVRKASPLVADLDVNNPVERRFSDEYLGTLNRRKILIERYDKAIEDRQKTFAGIRGAIALFLMKEN